MIPAQSTRRTSLNKCKRACSKVLSFTVGRRCTNALCKLDIQLRNFEDLSNAISGAKVAEDNEWPMNEFIEWFKEKFLGHLGLPRAESIQVRAHPYVAHEQLCCCKRAKFCLPSNLLSIQYLVLRNLLDIQYVVCLTGRGK